MKGELLGGYLARRRVEELSGCLFVDMSATMDVVLPEHSKGERNVVLYGFPLVCHEPVLSRIRDLQTLAPDVVHVVSVHRERDVILVGYDPLRDTSGCTPRTVYPM